MGISSIDWDSAYKVVRQVVRKSIPVDHVEDVVQNTLIAAIPLLESGNRGEAQQASLLRTIAKRRAADYWRKSKGSTVAITEEHIGVATVIDPVLNLQSDEAMAILVRLSVKDKEVLYYGAWLGLDFVDMERNRGGKHSVSYEAFRNRYRRALVHFATELDSKPLAVNCDTKWRYCGCGCGNTFPDPGNRRRYYNSSCRSRVHKRKSGIAEGIELRVCALPDCDNMFFPSWKGRKRIYCHDLCARKARHRKSDISEFMERECALEGCYVIFKPNNRRKYCCNAHKARAYRKRKKEEQILAA